MEEVFLRFRHLGEQIFELLDTGSLNKCTKVDKSWNEFVTAWKLPWIRMIQNCVRTAGPWREFFRKANIEKLKVIVEAMPYDDEFFPHNGAPLIFAAMSGNVEIVAELLETESKKKQPEDHNGRTPLHYAAEGGSFKVCKLIMKNLRSFDCKLCVQMYTYTATDRKSLKYHYRTIHKGEKIPEVKNPADHNGVTPLHKAAK